MHHSPSGKPISRAVRRWHAWRLSSSCQMSDDDIPLIWQRKRFSVGGTAGKRLAHRRQRQYHRRLLSLFFQLYRQGDLI